MHALGYAHGLTGSACPTKVGNAAYMTGFKEGWLIWAKSEGILHD